MQLIDSQTYKNLARAYSGECQAQTRYRFIEFGARMKNLTALSEIIDKIVYNEFNHARMFYTQIQKASKETIDSIEFEQGTPFREKWDLVENLRLASQDEADEVRLYPKFAKIAEKEGFIEIAELFNKISKIEAQHQKIFVELYEQLSTDTMYKRDKKTKWRCSACGYEESGLSAFEVCPVCLAKQGVVSLHLKSLSLC